MKTGLLLDDVFLNHHAVGHHPEQPERLAAIRKELNSRNLAQKCEVVSPRDATKEEILRVHTSSYLDRLERSVPGNTGHLDADTFYSPGSWDAALKAAGGTVDLALSVLKGELDNGAAFVRPPGHHATPGRAMGFCLLNNIAIAAAAALDQGAERVAIVDWDLHHGNGTQDIFYGDPKVLYTSLHMFPHYPGTGGPNEMGSGAGKGFTVNFPMPPYSGFPEFEAAFAEALLPILEQYNPDLLLVSAGFDAHERDPLGALQLDDQSYASMTGWLRQTADKCCGGKLVCVLEGGYDLQAIAGSGAEVISGLLDDDPKIQPPESDPSVAPVVRKLLDAIKEILAEHWSL